MLEATLTGSGTSWTATLALLSTREPVTVTGTSQARALGALVKACLRQVADEARAQGVTLGPTQLVASEWRVRAACSLALFRLNTPTPTLTVTDPYGTDVSTFPDLDPSFKALAGQRAVAEAVARRWITPLGTLVYDADYGEDVRALLNAEIDSPRLQALRAALVGQALADERVVAATVDLTTSGPTASKTLTLRGRITTATGPFSLVLTIDALNANLQILRA